MPTIEQNLERIADALEKICNTYEEKDKRATYFVESVVGPETITGHPEAAKTIKKKRKRRTKAEIEAARQAEETQEKPDDTSPVLLDEDEPEYTLDDVKHHLNLVCNEPRAGGVVQAQEFVSGFNIKNINDLPEEAWATIINKCKGALSDGGNN